jgi:3-dehydroquinate dehydratase II
MKKKVLIINGPNLNMLGIREPDKYGSATLEDINKAATDFGIKIGLDVDVFQSNHEGELIEKIQAARRGYNALIINPAAYTHSSIAIRDAILLLEIPVVEIHLSNIYKRESFRQKSMISDVVSGQIAGFGKHGYILALQAVHNLIS